MLLFFFLFCLAWFPVIFSSSIQPGALFPQYCSNKFSVLLHSFKDAHKNTPYYASLFLWCMRVRIGVLLICEALLAPNNSKNKITFSKAEHLLKDTEAVTHGKLCNMFYVAPPLTLRSSDIAKKKEREKKYDTLVGRRREKGWRCPADARTGSRLGSGVFWVVHALHDNKNNSDFFFCVCAEPVLYHTNAVFILCLLFFLTPPALLLLFGVK